MEPLTLDLKKLDGNYTRMLRAILNKSWRQHPTRHQLYGHLPPITKTIQVRRTRHAGHCRRSKDELIRDVLLWTSTHGHAKAGRPARTYIQQLYEDTGCCPENLPGAMNDREKWREGYPCYQHDMMMMMMNANEWMLHTFQNWNFPNKFSLVSYPKGSENSSIFTNPSARAGYDTRSIFKRSLTGFNSEFSFSKPVASPRLKKTAYPTIYP